MKVRQGLNNSPTVLCKSSASGCMNEKYPQPIFKIQWTAPQIHKVITMCQDLVFIKGTFASDVLKWKNRPAGK